jgi:hypothetical protein
MNTITLRYLATTEQLALESLLINDDQLKERILARLNITRRDNESASDAWARTMHEENNLPFSKPFHRSIVDAIQDNREAFRFFFVLA